MKNILLIILTLFSVSFYSQENKSEAGGPPEINQIIGFWKKIDFPQEKEMNKENPWPQKYQWFAFYKNGRVYSMMSDIDNNYNSGELKQIFDKLPADKSPSYKYD